MADTKISALTAATTPLAGTEVLPIVQSSATKKVAVSDLTAGRSVSALDLTLTGLSASLPVFTNASKNLTNTGTVPITNGGTNSTATPTNGGVTYGTGSAYAVTSAGTTNQLLQSAGAAAPTWTSAINGVSIGQTTRDAGNFTTVLAGTSTNTFSGTLVSAGDFEQKQKRWGYRGANGTSAGTTGTYTVDLSGFPGQGSGSTNELITCYWVTFMSSEIGRAHV